MTTSTAEPVSEQSRLSVLGRFIRDIGAGVRDLLVGVSTLVLAIRAPDVADALARLLR